MEVELLSEVPALLVHVVLVQELGKPGAPHWAQGKQLAQPFLDGVAHHISCAGLSSPESVIHLRALAHTVHHQTH